MSSVAQIVANAHTFAGTTSSQISDTLVLGFVNLAYHDLEEIIRNYINEDYFYDYFTTDTKLNQSEYNFADIAPSSTAPGILKIISVGVKYGIEDTQYRPIKPFGSGSLNNTPEYLAANQSQSDPFYIYKDNSLFIYPAPDDDGDASLVDGDTVIDDGLRVHASVSLIDLIEGGAESTVKIPRNHHKAIALGAANYIYLNRNLGGTGIAQANYQQWLDAIEMLKDNLRDRTLSPLEQDLPVLSSLMY